MKLRYLPCAWAAGVVMLGCSPPQQKFTPIVTTGVNPIRLSYLEGRIKELESQKQQDEQRIRQLETEVGTLKAKGK